MIKNADTIKCLQESEFLSKEIQDMKWRPWDKPQAANRSSLEMLEDKMNDMEKYPRRWNLGPCDLPEQEGETGKQRCLQSYPAAQEETCSHTSTRVTELVKSSR